MSDMTANYKVTVSQTRLFPVILRTVEDQIQTDAGVRLHELMVEESRTRADGLGGRDGAVDTGTLSNSICITKTAHGQVVVGTRLHYARNLAFGLPDPGASLAQIQKWRDRKRVPRRARTVWEKIKTRGPIPNPFHERASKRFEREIKQIIRESVGRAI